MTAKCGDHQVAHVVRHLVRQHGKRGNHPQPQVGHEGRGNQDAVAKAMHAVAGEHRPATGLGTMVVGVVMPAGVVVFMRVRVGRCMCAPLLHLRSVVMPGRAVPRGGWQPVAVFVAVFVAVVPEFEFTVGAAVGATLSRTLTATSAVAVAPLSSVTVRVTV